MLGELVAQEIKQIDYEKTCECPACAVNGTMRAIRVFVVSHECDCPVCEVTKTNIAQMGKKLDKVFEKLRLGHERIDPLLTSPIFVAEHEQDVRNLAGLEGGIMYASKVIQNMINDYCSIIDAAHAAYQMVAQSTLSSSLPDALTRKLRALVGGQNTPRGNGNGTDVN